MSQQPFSRQDLTALLVGFGLVVSVIVFFAIKNTSPEKRTEVPDENPMSSEFGPSIPTISFLEARRKLSSDTSIRVIDIRSEVEYQAMHIVDSVSVPAERLSEFFPAPDEKELVVVPAQDEKITMKASEILSGKNIRHAFLDGNIVDWGQAGGRILSFGNPTSPTDRSKVTLINADDFKKAVEDREMLHAIIDVRNREDFLASHIPEAMNIPLPELERRRAEIPPATNIAVYAGNSLDAFQAAVRLFDLGMFSVKTLEVGFPEWESKGMPIEKTK